MAKAKKEPENTNSYWYEMQILPTQTITKEQEKSIIAKIAKKYNVSPGKVRFTTKKVYPNGEAGQDTALNAEMINNIKDPKFQQQLFKQYIEQNGVKDYNILQYYLDTLKFTQIGLNMLQTIWKKQEGILD